MTDATKIATPKPATAAMAPKRCPCGGVAGPIGECEECKKKRQSLQRAGNGGPGPTSVPASVSRTIGSAGRPLDAPTRSHLESSFGRDLSAVRIHNDSQAAESARAINARAYTVGQHIAFGHNQYQPRTPAGSGLLAHEIAHTVQQRGLQRMPSGPALLEPSQESRYEHEAHQAASRIAQGKPASGTTFSRPAGQIVSRATDPPTAVPPPDEEPTRAWEPVPTTSPLATIPVAKQSKLRPGVISPTIRAFGLGTFNVPPEKGPVAHLWNARAEGGGLESFIDADGTVRAGLKQERPSTDQLRNIWRAKAGLESAADAATAWAAAGGDKATTFDAKVGGKTCQMDHIIELQIGGNNIPENIAPLDAAENQKSGRDIFAELREKATKIRAAQPSLETVILSFDRAVQTSATCGPCCQTEKAVLAAAGKAVSGATADSDPYPIVAAVPTTLSIDKGYRTPRKAAKLPIEESAYPQTKAASTLIPGMILRTLNLQPKGNDTIDAYIDTTNAKTRVPITIENEKANVPLTVDDVKRELKLAKPKPGIAFTYPYLSKGIITDLTYDQTTGLSGKGTLTPNIPFLNKMKLGVEFSPDRFEITAGLDPEKMTMPFRAVRLTKAQIGLLLHPEFKPTGEIGFEIVPGGKKLFDGSMTFEADASGLVAVGKVYAYLPGVDKAEGTIEYRGQQWSGRIEISSSQIKLPYVKQGTMIVTVTAAGFGVTGDVLLAVPGGNEVGLGVQKKGAAWIFAGQGVFNVPGIEPVNLNFTYDGVRLKAVGKTAIVVRGFRGDLTVYYTDGRISGEGVLSGKKGRATLEEAKIKYNGETGKFSGSGSLSYQISENLIATAGVDIPEIGPVKVKGALTFPKPIELFKGFGDQKTIFKAPTIKIPIPGASIGPVGLVITIDGSIVAGYQIGPGQLENTKIAANFNPFEEDKDLSVDLQSRLAIPAKANIGGSVRAALAIDAVIASVSGGITVTALVGLEGGVFMEFTAHYEKDRFIAKAVPEIKAGMVLLLGIDADVMAKAGIGWFSVETKKVWNLKNFRYDTGLQFGMKAPISYDSAANPPFMPPTLDSIEWIIPDIKPGDMFDKLMAGGGKETTAA